MRVKLVWDKSYVSLEFRKIFFWTSEYCVCPRVKKANYEPRLLNNLAASMNFLKSYVAIALFQYIPVVFQNYFTLIVTKQ